MRRHTFVPLRTLRTLTFIASLVAALCELAPAARAQGAAFGAPGEFVVTGDLEGHLRKGWELRLHPSLDYFTVQNVSVGGVFGFTYTSGNPSKTTLDLGVRAGYSLVITPQVTFWPTAGIFYSHTSFSSGGGGGSSTNLAINAPFLFHIVPHFFVGAGPVFTLPLDSGDNGYGLQTVVGGWF